jgi:sulfur transfer complex TusBCD TusB component (DsrH family)
MTLEQAKDIAAKYMNDTNHNIFVCSDSSIYLNSPLSRLQEHCKENKLELFVIKNDLQEIGVEEVEKKSKKKQS